jgi:hypothetical protein
MARKFRSYARCGIIRHDMNLSARRDQTAGASANAVRMYRRADEARSHRRASKIVEQHGIAHDLCCVADSGGRVQRRMPLQQCLRRHGKIALGKQRRIGSGSLRRGLWEPLQRRRVSDEVDRGHYRSHAPNPMTISAVSDTHGVARTRDSSVVLPLPRKPRQLGGA